ncbi:HAD-IB family hydrolase [Candidatus Acidulodesulfobacterium sp. H_13]|uniref:HAD-IB family hydrolase n=1 Tax=Candidatus Acidulodesulfobacterium sp. H_13 TaxID=3395470 RepID=UPI003AF8D1F9
MKIAFFDFDGTITTGDSLLRFIRFVVADRRFLTGLVALSPVLILYKLKLIPNYKAKQKMLSWFFKDIAKDIFLKASMEYSLKHIDSIVRPKAIDKIKWHKDQGHKVVIVSASMECLLKPWCERNSIELLATKLKITDMVTGDLLTKNCYGVEKVNRIKEEYSLNEYEYIYAYGDSIGDKHMLELANERYYKPFRG